MQPNKKQEPVRACPVLTCTWIGSDLNEHIHQAHGNLPIPVDIILVYRRRGF